MICGSGGSKSRLAKAAGAETYGEMRHEKLHAVVARSTFPSQNVKNTRGSDHFWRFRCRFASHAFRMLNLYSFHLISSHRSFYWKLLSASLCHHSLCHPISSQLSSCLLSFFTSSHLIPSHVFSPFLSSSQLITAVLFSSHVI